MAKAPGTAAPPGPPTRTSEANQEEDANRDRMVPVCICAPGMGAVLEVKVHP